MPILATITINGTDHRISDEFVEDSNFLDAKISSLAAVRYATDKQYGGFVAPKFGTLELLPDLFDDDWPPPVSCDITIQWTDTDQAGAVDIFSGVGHLAAMTQDGVRYRLYPPDDSDTGTMTFTSDLASEFSSACTTLGLTLDTSLTTRAATTDTDYSPSGERDILTSLSELAAFFCHYFWIDGSTLYLADMLVDNGSAMALTEFDILPASYEMPEPVSIFKSGDYSVDGSHAYGKEVSISPVCHSAQTDIEAALGNIKTIMESNQIKLACPLVAANIPAIGQKITLTDQSRQADLDITMWCRALVYDFDKLEMVIEGEGAIT